jgi:hypothetical protein
MLFIFGFLLIAVVESFRLWEKALTSLSSSKIVAPSGEIDKREIRRRERLNSEVAARAKREARRELGRSSGVVFVFSWYSHGILMVFSWCFHGVA